MKRAGIVTLAFALSACASGATETAPPTAPSSPSQPAATASPVGATIALASPAQTATTAPSEAPSPSFPLLGSLRIPFANREMEITVVGRDGIVLAWRAAVDHDLDAIAWEGDTDIALGRLSARELVLGWIGTVCDVRATLTIAPGWLVVTPVPREGCDLGGVARGMVLTFPDPVDPAALTVELGERVLIP